MTNEEIKNKLSNWYSDLTFIENGTYLNIEVPENILKPLAEKLRFDTECAFDYMFCHTGVDFGEELGVMIHLESTKYRHIIVLTVKTKDRENPELDSIHDIWPAAFLQEMEVFDFFGIKFKGHPQMKRLFMGEEWVGYPLRKDYVDNANMIIR